MGINIVMTGVVLFLFSIAVIRIFNEVEDNVFRSIFVVLFIFSGLSIPVGGIISIWY